MTEEKNASVKDGPVDKFKGVYIIFFWLGIGTLLPWNMFISVSKSAFNVNVKKIIPMNALVDRCLINNIYCRLLPTGTTSSEQ